MSTPPLILTSDDNKFYNGDIYYEAITELSEISVSDEAMNITFEKPSREELKNFSFTYHTAIDRRYDTSDIYIPSDVSTHIIDAIDREIDEVPKDENYILVPNYATLVYAGAMNGITLTTEKLKNIREDLLTNTKVTLTANSKIYAANNNFAITFNTR